MSALCAIPALPGPAQGQFEAGDALLLVAGEPLPEAHLLAWTREGPLDERSVRLALDPAYDPHRILGLRAALVWPIRLADGEVIHQTMATGPIVWAQDHEQSGQRERTLELRDEWSALLTRSSSMAFRERAGTLTLSAQPTSLRAGSRANRSRRRWPIQGSEVHLPSDAAHAWTLGQAIETLLATHGVTLDAQPAPIAAANRALPHDVDLLAPLRDSLGPLLKEHGLRLLVHITGLDGSGQARVSMCDAHGAKLVSGLRSLEVSRRSTLGNALARRWLAIGPPWEVETTQRLAPAWRPVEASLPDGSYHSGHSDFYKVSHVFRRWLLNEDGGDPALPQPDLRSVIGERLAESPLPWLERLPQGAGGERPPPLIEFSLDEGASWTRWAGPARVLSDRAGVALLDDALPAAFISACRAGAASVRVTGCLRGGPAVTAEAWTGNTHAGRAPDVELRAPTSMRFQRLDPDAAPSPVDATPPQPIDDRPALASWLLDRAASDAAGGSIRVTLAGAHPLLAPGDRLRSDEPHAPPRAALIHAVRITSTTGSGTVTQLDILPEPTP